MGVLSNDHPNDRIPRGLPKALLIVADPEINLMLLDHLLVQEWTVEYVASNDDALALVKKRPFDLILTAEATSVREDIDLLRDIRKLHPHTRMIIVTQEGTAQDVILALRQRAFSLFSRPYSLESLTEMIHMAMEGPAWDDGIEVVSAKPGWVRLLVRADQGTGLRMMRFFEEMTDLPEDEKAKIAYALREMLMNAIAHGAQFDPNQYVELGYFRGRGAVACRVKDPGKGFSLDELKHAAISNPLDNPVRHILYREETGLPPGGYGILLSRHLVDELVYNEQGNEVLLIKYLEPENPDSILS